MEYKELLVTDVWKEIPNYYSIGYVCLKDNCHLIYLKNGIAHRHGGPASIEVFRQRNGNIYKMYFEFFINGLLHNENGQAAVYYYASDNYAKPESFYYLNGDEYSKKQYEKQILTKLYW